MFSFSGYLSTQGLGAGVSSTQQGEGGEVPRGRSRSCHRGWGRRARQGRPQMASVLVPCAALTNCHKMTRVCLCACVQLLSHDQLFVTPSTIVPQVPVSMQVPRQEYWSGLPFPTPGDLPDRGIEPMYAALQVDSLPLSSVQSSHSVVSNSLRPHGLQRTRLPCPLPIPRACSSSCQLSW